ncbi:MAG: helix-turn-helix domain-containing protein [Steroidobacteraceae bacterium]
MTAQSGLGLGARLASARARTRLTVIQAAERLHVDPRVIEALEAERFEELGAAVYVRGHIRHYAELVAEQPAELQGLYATTAHAAEAPDLTRAPHGESPVESSRALLVPAVVVVAAVAVIGVVWWVAGTLRVISLSQRLGAAAMSQPLSPARKEAGAVPAPAQQAPPGTIPAAVQAATAQGVGARGIQAPGTEALLMRFTQGSWAEVYDASGKRLFYDNGSADSTRTVSGTPPLRVVLGNPAGVSLLLDGRPVSIPGGGERGSRVEFQIAGSGRTAPHLAAADARSAPASRRESGGPAP